jgi:hypothetical protein
MTRIEIFLFACITVQLYQVQHRSFVGSPLQLEFVVGACVLFLVASMLSMPEVEWHGRNQDIHEY